MKERNSFKFASFDIWRWRQKSKEELAKSLKEILSKDYKNELKLQRSEVKRREKYINIQ